MRTTGSDSLSVGLQAIRCTRQLIVLTPPTVIAGRVLAERELDNPVHRRRDVVFDRLQLCLAERARFNSGADIPDIGIARLRHRLVV